MADTTLLTLLDNLITLSENKKQSGYQTLIYNKLLELSKNNAETASLLGLDAEILAEAQTAEAMSTAIQEIVTDKVNSALAGGGGSGGSSIDLSNYYKKSETDQKIQQALANGSQSDWSITDTSKAAYIKNKPTKLSQFENDTNFLTSHQSLEAYATKTYVQDLLSQGNFDIDLSDYVLAGNLDNAVSTLGYLKTIPSEYVTMSQMENKKYLTQDTLEPYITEAELNEKGFLTEHQSLADYATRVYVQEYAATKDWVTEYVVGVTTNGEIDLSTYASKMYVDDIASAIRKEIPILPDLTLYATQAWVAEQLAAYNPEGVDENAVKQIIETYGFLTMVPDTYATKEYVTEQLQTFTPPASGGESGSENVDLSGYYTSEQVDNKLLEYLLLADYDKDKHIKIVNNQTTLNNVSGLNFNSYLAKTLQQNEGNLIFVKPNSDTDELFGLVYVSESKMAYKNIINKDTITVISGLDENSALTVVDINRTQSYNQHILSNEISNLSIILTDDTEQTVNIYRYNSEDNYFYQYDTNIKSDISLSDIQPVYQTLIMQNEFVLASAINQFFIDSTFSPTWKFESPMPEVMVSTSQVFWVTNFQNNKQYTVEMNISSNANTLYYHATIYSIDEPLTDAVLTPYATQSWVQEKIAAASLGGGEGSGSGVDIESLLSIYATKDAVNTLELNLKNLIPSNMSQLINDVGYLTAVPQDVLDKYVSFDYFNSIYNPGDPWVTQSTLAGLIPTVPTQVSAFANDIGYATETFVTSKIAEAAFSAAGIDLSAYALKSYVDSKIPTVPTNISAFNNDKGYITETSLLYNAQEGYILSYSNGTYVWIDSSSFSSGGGSSSGDIVFETTNIDFSQLTFV